MNDSAGQVRYDITANADDFLDQLRAAGRAIDAFGDKVSDADEQLIREWNNLADEMFQAAERGAIEAIKPITNFCSETISQISQMNSSIVQAGLSSFQILSGAAATSLMSLASKGLQGADDLAKYNAQIIGMANSTEDANSAMSEAVKFFKQNPFQRFETVEAVKNLMTYDKSIADAASNSERLTQTLDMLGVASLSTNVPISELASKWGEVTSQARVSKGQFEELALRVPALYDAVGKKMGISSGEVSEALDRVGIDTQIVKDAMMELYGLDTTKLNLPKSSKEFQEYFNSLSGAARQSAEAYLAFGNTMARQTDRVNGRIANLAQKLVGYELDAQNGFKAMEGGIYQSVINLKRAFADSFSTDAGEKLYAALDKLGKQIAPIIDKIAEKIPFAIEKLADATDFLAEHFDYLKVILGGALILFGSMADKIPVVGAVFSQFTGPIKNLLNVFTKFNPLVQALMAILGAGAFKAIQDGKLSAPLKSILSSLERIGKALKPVAENVAKIFARIGETVVVSLIESLAKVLEVLANVIEKIHPEALTAIVMGILSFRTISSVASPIITTVKNINALKESLTEFFNIRSGAIGGIEKIKNALSGVSNTATEAGKMAETASAASSSIQKASASMTKGQQAMSTMRSAILNIVLIAGSIAAMGIALKIAYEAIPDDLLGLAAKLGVLAGAIVVFGAIAVAIDKVNLQPTALLAIAGMAVDIALMAGAIWVANLAIPDDVGKIIPKLVVIAAVIAAMGILSGVLGITAIAGAVATGLVLIAGMAVDIALVGVALGVANAMIPDDVGKLYEKLGVMAVAIGGMAILSAAIGALMLTGIGAAALSVGIAAVIALCGEITVCALAIGAVNALVPNDIGETKKKIDLISDVLNHMAEQNFGNLFSNLLNSWSLAPLAEIAEMYAHIAECLNVIGKTEIDKTNILAKVDLITETVNKISDTGPNGNAGMIQRLVNDFLQVIDTAMISKIVDIYYDIATKLNEIQNVDINSKSINEKLGIITSVVETVGSTKEGDFSKTLENTAKLFFKMVDTSIVANMVNTYRDIAKTLTEIQNIDINQKTIRSKILLLSDVIKDVGGINIIDTSGKNILEIIGESANLAIQSNATENIGKVINTYGSIVDSLKAIKELNLDDAEKEDYKKRLQNLGEIVKVVLDTKGDSGVLGTIASFFAGGSINEEQVSKVQSIINKFTEIAKTLNGMESMNFDWNKQKIENVRDCIYEISQINEAQNIGNKEWIVGMSLSILYKMNEFVSLLNTIPNLIDDKKDNMIKIRGVIYDSCQINEGVGDIGRKEEIVSQAVSIVNKMIEFANSMNLLPKVNSDRVSLIQQIVELMNTTISSIIDNITSRLPEFNGLGTQIVQNILDGINSLIPQVSITGQSIQGTIWNAIEPKLQDEFFQGAELVRQFIDGMRTMNPSLTNAGRDVQGLIWNAIEPKMKDEYYQGQALAQNLINGFNSKHQGDDTFYNAGANAVQGFINGANSRNVYSVGWQIASNYLQGLKDKGKQGSPWKTTYQSGVWAVEGMIDGIEKMKYKLVDTAKSISELVIESLSIEDLADTIGFNNLKNLSMTISGQGEEGTLGGVSQKSNTINIYNNNYAQSDFNKISRDIMFNISRL